MALCKKIIHRLAWYSEIYFFVVLKTSSAMNLFMRQLQCAWEAALTSGGIFVMYIWRSNMLNDGKRTFVLAQRKLWMQHNSRRHTLGRGLRAWSRLRRRWELQGSLPLLFPPAPSLPPIPPPLPRPPSLARSLSLSLSPFFPLPLPLPLPLSLLLSLPRALSPLSLSRSLSLSLSLSHLQKVGLEDW